MIVNQFQELESEIAYKFNVHHCLYTHSGTSALYISFLYIKSLGRTKILIPNIICPQVVIAAIRAGLDYEFCDISLDDYVMDLDSIKQIYKINNFDALLLAHVYGHICSNDIINFCKFHDIFIIEDCAQTYKVNPLCDLSIFSFGHTKFLDNDFMGGGILSMNDLSKLRCINNTLASPILDDLDYNLQEYRKEFYNLDKSNDNYFTKFQELLLKYTKFYKVEQYNFILYKKLEQLEHICKNRIKKMQIYKQEMIHDLIIHPKLSHNSIAWRYTFRFLGDREKLLVNLRKNNIDCSSWYIGCNKIFKKKALKNSIILENQIVNLWLDEKTSMEKIQDNIKKILYTIHNLSLKDKK
ncbi:DegT/DnrJ/EryC1/StrS family aminotransferase [Campylobacter sp. IFREMER_LSEM_CL1904]|nr:MULTISPECIES: DegT/DnrJ/EryC1/StrS family aminotransferase [unclassified Campylobacter]MCV3428669.1 DegT/DnrJ/EryC1/StrS family aminotransferase [Campylobacter sp. IFREMER_LSEM_CL1904]MCV3480259.1 DegT/DnrJ/EryC1/StrS family aminotransferase [Campylobacter sp. CNRCH_2015_1657]MCV3553971.1 DegT/DnrJ/EryC1/StrS family aminotransferase [Campylobacter sp. CNRCH_2013_0898h]